MRSEVTPRQPSSSGCLQQGQAQPGSQGERGWVPRPSGVKRVLGHGGWTLDMLCLSAGYRFDKTGNQAMLYGLTSFFRVDIQCPGVGSSKAG
jgi:hypothetical protein